MSDKAAIIVNDMQSKFFRTQEGEKDININAFRTQFAAIKKLLEFSLERGIFSLIVAYNDFVTYSGQYVDSVPNNQERSIKYIQPSSGLEKLKIFVKNHDDPFNSHGFYGNYLDERIPTRTTLHYILSEERINFLVMCGLDSHACVKDAIEEANRLKYAIGTSPDIILTHSSNPTIPAEYKYIENLHVFKDVNKIISHLKKNKFQ